MPESHLPECPGYPYTDDSSECICAALRACEARVFEDERRYRNEVEHKYQLAADEGATAYAEGQRDERERIVKAVEVWAARSAYGLKSWDGLFAVIDALR